MGDTKFPAHHIRIRACLIATVTASIALAACSSSSSTSTSASTSTSTNASQSANSNSGTKLILFELAFPCGLNSGISELCASVTAQAAKLPPEQFPIEAFVGMISDEIEALRKQGKSDDEIARVVRENSKIQVSGTDISRNYAPPEERHQEKK